MSLIPLRFQAMSGVQAVAVRDPGQIFPDASFRVTGHFFQTRVHDKSSSFAGFALVRRAGCVAVWICFNMRIDTCV